MLGQSRPGVAKSHTGPAASIIVVAQQGDRAQVRTTERAHQDPWWRRQGRVKMTQLVFRQPAW